MDHHLSVLQQIVYFAFIVPLFGMMAGTAFFFSQKSELEGEYKQTAILSGVIGLVATMPSMLSVTSASLKKSPPVFSASFTFSSVDVF